ncbi:MAG: ornithine cyclodeaminase [Acidimicrobiia bacterium]
MRYLDAAATRAALSMQDAIEAMRAAFSDDREHPPRVALAGSLFMPGRVGSVTGIKVVSTVPGNPVGIVVAFGPDGAPLGIVDGPTLTAIRTAAGAGLATSLMAPEESSVMAMLGAGAMAADQVAAVRAVRPIERVLVWSRTPGKADLLAELIGAEAVKNAGAAVAQADIITTATPATTPLFAEGDVRVGAHINAVGAFTPGMIEVPPGLTQLAFTVVDDTDAAAAEAGDLLQASKAPDATIGDLLAGRAAVPSGLTTLFKSVGIASQDVAAAEVALRHAAETDLGVEL